MNRKIIAMGVLVFLATTAAPVFAESGKDTVRIEKLEERTRDLEARLAQVEASSNKQMGMMKQDHGMPDKGMGMGMNNPMGQAPQQVPQQNPGTGAAMPQAPAPQQPAAGMPAGGGMGDM